MKRKPDESFEDYKGRRSLEDIITRRKLKPIIFWDSKGKGTYRRDDRKSN